MQDYDWLTVVAGFLDELARFREVVLKDGRRPDPGLIGTAAGKYGIARAVIVRLTDSPGKISHLVHHVKQRLARLLVIERRVKEVRSEPALYADLIEEERLQVGVLSNLGDELKRRFLPPVQFTRCEAFCCLPGVGDVPPDDFIDVDVLGTD